MRRARCLGVIILVVACGSEPRAPAPPPLPAPRAAGDAVRLLRAVSRAGELDPLNALLIYHRDSLVSEHYFRGMTPDRPVNVKSVSKTLLSPLVGIALRDSLLAGPHQPLVELLPELANGAAPAPAEKLTLHHLLSMTLGLRSTSFDNYGPWVTSRNWVQYALRQPPVCPPGACWEYSTGNTHLLSVILSRRAGTDLVSWGRRVLFDSLGIPLRPWDRDPQGYYLGGNNMRLTPRELVRFGRLFLDSGRVNGSQLVPWEWIEQSWTVIGRSPWNGHGFGYLWWTRRINRETVRFGWGYGGQFLFLVPRLDLAVVVTSSLTNRPSGVRHNPQVYDLLGCHVIPAFRHEPDVGWCDWRT
jgi:CubicO group peptidase (beta-lactamase class C family)